MLTAIALFVAVALQAQTFSTSGWWKPAEPPFSPVVGADGMITFRLKAPKARVVKLAFGEGKILVQEMKQRPDGVWETTIGPVAPGEYEYKFEVDGLKVLDYGNPSVKAGTEIYCNTVDVPGDRIDTRDLTGSEVDVISYRSSVLGTYRRVCVYVPAVYFEQPKRKFPVLYLRHGGGDHERSWWESAHADAILDHALAAGAEPMLVVMTNGLTDGSWAGGSTPEGMALLEQELLSDVIPLVEKRYRVRKDRLSRAIAGLSMGGGHTISASVLYPEMFDYICPLSAAGQASPEQIAALKKAGVKLYFLACGDADFLFEGSKTLDKTLTEQGLDHIYFVSDGGHTWSNWRLYLNTFAPKLFK
jgi:enterochelin esterase family protein